MDLNNNLHIYGILQLGTINNVETAIKTLQNTTIDLTPYLTIVNASSTYATKTSLSDYALTSSLSNYLTTANATTTYATKTNLNDYLTTANATTTYATKTNLLQMRLQHMQPKRV